MSTLTSVEYFQADFDANSLKVAQLRGILLEHGISLPGIVKKGDLVQAFEERVRPKGVIILAAASKVKASNKGIISVSENGDETVENPETTNTKRRGRPRKTVADSSPVEEEPPAKKSRARSSRSANSTDIDPAPTKRGRGRPPKARISDEGNDAEIEDEDTPAPRTTTRSRQSTAATSSDGVTPTPASTRRQSNIASSSSSISSEMLASKSDRIQLMDEVVEESEKEDQPVKKVRTPKTPRSRESGFSDRNPFQSGSEDAAERESRRRKSSIGTSTKKPSQPRISEPAPAPAPIVKPSPTGTPGILRRVGPSRENLKTPPKEVVDDMRRQKELQSAQEHHANSAKLSRKPSEDGEPDPEISVASHIKPVSESTSLVKRVQAELPTVTAPRSTIPLSALFLLLLSILANYKTKSSSLGFCDSGATTNDIVLNRQSALDNANACIARRTVLDLNQPGAGKAIECDVSGLPLIPFLPRPTECAACPLHAVCDQAKVVACAPEYIFSYHPLTIISPLVDGLPGIGPEAFPPSCRPDTVRKRMIGGLAKEMEADLARGRGLVVCAGMGKDDGGQGLGERYGVEETTLREMFESRRDPKFSKEHFDEIFEAALRDLVEHEDVFESIDVNGRSWYCAARTEMTLACKARMGFVDLLDTWKSQLGSTAAVLALIGYLRSTMKHRQNEKYRAEELAQVVLKRLQDQEHLHYSDPVTTPNPFIPPTQLRDLVLPHGGSSAHKTRLWKRVTELVEGNANVAVREREVRGEVWSTWEWAGVGERHVTWG